jgi:hypothetical protein
MGPHGQIIGSPQQTDIKIRVASARQYARVEARRQANAERHLHLGRFGLQITKLSE